MNASTPFACSRWVMKDGIGRPISRAVAVFKLAVEESVSLRLRLQPAGHCVEQLLVAQVGRALGLTGIVRAGARIRSSRSRCRRQAAIAKERHICHDEQNKGGKWCGDTRLRGRGFLCQSAWERNTVKKNARQHVCAEERDQARHLMVGEGKWRSDSARKSYRMKLGDVCRGQSHRHLERQCPGCSGRTFRAILVRQSIQISLIRRSSARDASSVAGCPLLILTIRMSM